MGMDVPVELAIVDQISKRTNGFDRSLQGAHTDHEVTRSQVYLDGLEYVPVATPSPTVDVATHTIEVDEQFEREVPGLRPESDDVWIDVEPMVAESLPVNPPTEEASEAGAAVQVAVEAEPVAEPAAESAAEFMPEPAAVLPVRQGGATRVGRLVESTDGAGDQSAQLIALSPTQRRVLTCVAEATANGGGVDSVSVSLVKRSLGEVSRFGGAASPVGDAIVMLSASGLLVRTAESVSLTALGLTHIASVATD